MESIDRLKLEFFDTVAAGDAAGVERLLDTHPGLLASALYTNERHPPLHYAKKPKLAKLLITRGAADCVSASAS